MSRSFEPGEVGAVWLDKHNETPMPTRPVMFAKAPSARKKREIDKQWDRLVNQWSDNGSHADYLLTIFCEWFHDWKNFPVPFSREVVEDHITQRGMVELCRKFVSESLVEIEDKKKSESQP